MKSAATLKNQKALKKIKIAGGKKPLCVTEIRNFRRSNSGCSCSRWSQESMAYPLECDTVTGPEDQDSRKQETKHDNWNWGRKTVTEKVMLSGLQHSKLPLKTENSRTAIQQEEMSPKNKWTNGELTWLGFYLHFALEKPCTLNTCLKVKFFNLMSNAQQNH